MSYSPSPSLLIEGKNIKVVPSESFSSSEQAVCIVEFSPRQRLAVAKWVSPKRTRSYPFARLYKIYHCGMKRVALIPIIKDEGVGDGKNKANNDRINFTTLSWMNLTNIYVVLCWYESAEFQSATRITDQKFNDSYVISQLKKINNYQFDAHHWNQEHFKNDFIDVLDCAISHYKRISRDLGVKLHASEGHEKFRHKIVEYETADGLKLSLDKFREHSVKGSRAAASRESKTKHVYEDLDEDSQKAVFNLQNSLGGVYPLTCDEVFVDEAEKTVLIRESKNSSKDALASEDDIYDGLFKLLLFKHLKSLTKGESSYATAVELRLTGVLSDSIQLPQQKLGLAKYISENKFSKSEIKLLKRIVDEAEHNGISVVLEPGSSSEDPGTESF